MKNKIPYTINCKGQLISLEHPRVMGILNITPNSFYDGGAFLSEKQWLSRVEIMLQQGATFIDIGAYSSQPQAAFVTEAQEIERLLPVIQSVVAHFPEALLSIDTFRANVAHQALDHGAHIINDISAGVLDAQMFEVVAHHQAPYIMMHMKGTPQTMHAACNYDDLMKEIIFYFSERVALAKEAGIHDLILDPGFGFAKTLEQNYEVMRKLELFQFFDLPLLSGISRKSMIYKSLDITAAEALNGTTVLNTLSLIKGARILRVHDVKEAIECVKLVEQVYEKI